MGKIKITFVLQLADLGRLVKEPFEFSLDEGGTVVGVIKLVDEEILKRAGNFPVKGCKSLLHMVYHPFRKGSTSRLRSKATMVQVPSLTLEKTPKFLSQTA